MFNIIKKIICVMFISHSNMDEKQTIIKITNILNP